MGYNVILASSYIVLLKSSAVGYNVILASSSIVIL